MCEASFLILCFLFMLLCIIDSLEIGNMSNLEVLDVSKNRLSSLPSAIGKLKTLKQLYLAHNKLFYRPLTPELGKLNR